MSQLTSCSQLWRPHLIKHVLLMERVQRHATKYILGDFSSDYETRLFKLRLLSVMMHLEISDILFFVTSYQNPTNSFDIKNYVEFLRSHTHASRTFKLRHLYIHPTILNTTLTSAGSLDSGTLHHL